MLLPDTENLIKHLFKPDQHKRIFTALNEQVTPDLLGCTSWSPEQFSRIHFAMIKLTAQQNMPLDKAIELAKLDWRDLLMIAGFGKDIDAHLFWMKEILYPDTENKNGR